MLLLPGIVMALVVGITYLLMSHEEIDNFVGYYTGRSNFDNNILGPKESFQKILHIITGIMFGLQLLPILIVGISKIYTYEKLIDKYYSDTDNKSLRNVKIMLIMFIVASIFSLIANYVGKSYFYHSKFLLIMPSLLFSTLLFALSYIGYNLQYSAMDLEEIHSGDDDANISEDDSMDLQQLIIDLMERDKMFLQQDLKLSDMTAKLGTNRTYVYNTINIDMGMSFSDFVNKYRVEYSKQLLLDNSEMSMQEIASKSGFSSESAFYRNFKLVMGSTPYQWIKANEGRRQ